MTSGEILMTPEEHIAALQEALRTVRDYSAATFLYWTKDEDHKTGKRLKAMAGLLPGYHGDIDAAMELIPPITMSDGSEQR